MASYRKALQEAYAIARAQVEHNCDKSEENPDKELPRFGETDSWDNREEDEDIKMEKEELMNGFPSVVLPSDESGSEFDGGGPLMIDHVSSQSTKSLEGGEVADAPPPPPGFLSPPKQSCSILQQ